MIKLQFGLDFYEEPVTEIITETEYYDEEETDPETGEITWVTKSSEVEREQTTYITKSRPMIYDADAAIRGENYVHLITNGVITASFEGISDFVGYELLEGEWSEPEPVKPPGESVLLDDEVLFLRGLIDGVGGIA